MKKGKIFIYSVIFAGFILILFLSLKIFEMVYFNEKYYKVPDLKSYTYEEAEKIVLNTDLNVKKIGGEFSSYPIGQIFLQEPEPGTVVKKGRNIRVWVSNGAALVDMPDLTGMNFLDAKVLAEEKGMVVGNVITVKGNGKYNEVMATDPATNTLISKGQKISFLVNGLENVVQVRMPDIIGITVEEGQEILSRNSLIVGNIDYKELKGIAPGVVVKTSINSGDRVSAGSTINIVVSK